SCCVDEVAAQHVDADAIVHYGHACMSQTSRLPVIYVFGKKDIDIADCMDSLISSLRASPSFREDGGAIMLRHDVSYAHRASMFSVALPDNQLINELLEKLEAALSSSIKVLYTQIPLASTPARDGIEQAQTASCASTGGASDDTPVDDYTILFVGGESLSLTNLIMTHAQSEVHSYDPKTRTARIESGRTNKLLMRRYAVVQKARDADVFGILVGTLGVASYLPLISHLRTILSRAHKKSYTISVGKLNPAKLANFLEIDCFVLVACPENSLIDAKDFLRPIITPYELEIALRTEQSWTGQYVLDFDKLLTQQNPPEGSDEDLDQPVFSLVTGKYRHAKRYGAPASSHETSVASSAMVLRNHDNTVATLSDSAAGQFLQSRSFRGLEARLGQDAPSILEQGRSGIARGYQDD
ncbi:predicted protein, partial [Postia placenta Mad-698-R]